MYEPVACSLAGRYDNPNPTQFLVPIVCLKIPALYASVSLWSGSVNKYLIFY